MVAVIVAGVAVTVAGTAGKTVAAVKLNLVLQSF